MKRILLVDNANSFFSHFHAKDNDKAFNYIQNIRTIAEQFQVDRIIFAEEGGKSKWRLNLLPTYKGDREEKRKNATPEEQARYLKFRNEEFPEAAELAKTLGIKQVKVKGVEADDIISWLIRHIALSSYNILTLSTDYDIKQLLRTGCVQGGYSPQLLKYFSMKQKLPADMWMNTRRFIEENQIEPARYADVLALAGDAADSVPSIPGLGEGTALKLIQKYGDVQGVERNKDVLDVPRLAQKVKAGLKEDFSFVHRNMKLVNLNHTDEVDFEIFGAEGIEYLNQVLVDIAEPHQPDSTAIGEYFLEFGKLNEYENLEDWLAPFTRP